MRISRCGPVLGGPVVASAGAPVSTALAGPSPSCWLEAAIALVLSCDAYDRRLARGCPTLRTAQQPQAAWVSLLKSFAISGSVSRRRLCTTPLDGRCTVGRAPSCRTWNSPICPPPATCGRRERGRECIGSEQEARCLRMSVRFGLNKLSNTHTSYVAIVGPGPGSGIPPPSRRRRTRGSWPSRWRNRKSPGPEPAT